jgi:hypothetical protein
VAAGTIVFARPAWVGLVEPAELVDPVEPVDPAGVELAVVGALPVLETLLCELLVCGVPVAVVSPVGVPVPVLLVDGTPPTPADVVLTGVEDGVPVEPAVLEPVGVVVPVPSALGVEVGATGVDDGLAESVMLGGVPGP